MVYYAVRGWFIMTMPQENRVTYDDMSQNFSNVAKMVDRTGSAVVMKDNIPRYVILDFARYFPPSLKDEVPLRIGGEETATDAEVMASARNLIAQHLPAFQELAK
jgi:antitoxin Phd